MKKTPPLREYFAFSRKDRLAIGLFLFVVALLLAAPYLLPRKSAAFTALPDSLLAPRETRPDQTGPEAREDDDRVSAPDIASPRGGLFEFDPNQLDRSGWMRLGLPERVAGSIIRYREKGGRFRRPEDLKKIWSLPPGFYERVSGYIRMGEADQPARTWQGSTPPPSFARTYPTRPPISAIDINAADSIAWERLPGIGAKLTSRILRFRERLGGFYSVDQVAETWGLPDSTFQRIRPFLILNGGSTAIRKFNLNSATKEELKVHPYIRWNLANALVEYRNRHGAYQSVEEMKRVLILPDSVLTRLLPYLTIK